MLLPSTTMENTTTIVSVFLHLHVKPKIDFTGSLPSANMKLMTESQRYRLKGPYKKRISIKLKFDLHIIYFTWIFWTQMWMHPITTKNWAPSAKGVICSHFNTPNSKKMHNQSELSDKTKNLEKLLHVFAHDVIAYIGFWCALPKVNLLP